MKESASGKAEHGVNINPLYSHRYSLTRETCLLRPPLVLKVLLQ